MKNLILIGAGAWALEVWSWVKYAKGYGTEFTFKGFLSNNLNEIDDKEYCNGRIIDVIDEYEPKVNDVFVCVIGNVFGVTMLNKVLDFTLAHTRPRHFDIARRVWIDVLSRSTLRTNVMQYTVRIKIG